MDVKEELSEQKTLITDVMSPKSGSIVTLNSQENDLNIQSDPAGSRCARACCDMRHSDWLLAKARVR